MSQKRQKGDDSKPQQDCGTSDDKRRRKIPSLKSAILQVINLHKVHNYIEPVLEPLIRKVVREEVDLALRKYMTNLRWNCEKDVHLYEVRSLKLMFLNAISPPVFTGARIEGENCSSLKVALVDALTGQTVTSGPESSAKVEILALEGDFDGGEGDKWTLEEFTNNIVREREGKKALLSGDAFLNLKQGIGLVGDISFSDNSSWTRSRKFRLGVRLVDNFDGIKVKEAISESFIVRDHRGELYKKHYPPSLLDEVWRLEKISKEGAFHRRLKKERVNTVKDFLTLFYLEPTRLRKILGTGMSAKMWEMTVEHARTCDVDKQLYSYHPSGSDQKNGVIFNIVAQVMGLLVDCQKYVPADKLSETEKVEAHKLTISAFGHWEDVNCFNDESAECSNVPTIQCSTNLSATVNSACSDILTSQKVTRFDAQHFSAAMPDAMSSMYSPSDLSSLDGYGFHQCLENAGIDFDLPLRSPVQDINSFIRDAADSMIGDRSLPYFDHDYIQTPIFDPPEADLHSVPAQRRWKILFSVFRAVRRMVANKGKETCS
ncbi:calmodulin-binding protein 60 A-like isoform X1 [Ipomoea triloba]|uniref:calmodulin-binding protein 60 A-like isoform X1 n=1 Tax=Ipomoea triloba TaxID=35885 RepID=UPI00125E39DF|nr:calmodulin-binding protein 60 A-like isoform X1 [Ipomoea triloba]XP_031105081.1 calmodulin-binding protein 60 A-like isoform X1 [Ipomoea triloba]XP_031105082.1 calmodulin-binding protein 60 A-like isoform X1 [Ipomoea triloba]XP_031105083.1 calmodulin-binding protein 60 A-like isoform X1 [Ipomoea triloba]